MLFLNTVLLLGALGILIPVAIHLLNRRTRRVVDWGAMNFLLESLAIRNRRIQLEEALLMAARCLLAGLFALALARPFVPPGSTLPWMVILPLLLLAVVGLGVAAVLHGERKWQLGIGLGSLLILLACATLVLFEKKLNLARFNPGSQQDIALIIDGSTSMMAEGEEGDASTRFDRAVEEARELVRRAPRGHAFSLIVAGPSPGAKIPVPTSDRAELEAALDALRPLDGAMAAYDALTLASLTLARGDHPAKQIVLFTDGQKVGWEIGKSGRWNFLREAFANLPAEPQILLRRLPLPGQIRNLAVTDLTLSREIVGVDRPVEVSVTVENTGDEAVTPGALVLATGGGSNGGSTREYRDETLGQILPGESHRVTFDHHFTEAGGQSLTATLEVEDDIPQDNRADSALVVAGELRVLLVDGQPSGAFLQRSATFSALALAPSSLTLDPALSANVPGASDAASDDFEFDRDPTLDPVRFLVAPKVVGAPELATLPALSDYDAVILADVPRLPEAPAAALADYVAQGGGLLVTAGHRIQPDFYNQWTGPDDAPLLPARISGELRTVAPGETLHPSAQSLTHPALRKVADASRSDFATAAISAYRTQSIPAELRAETSVGAQLDNGETLLSSRQVGEGRVVFLGTALDSSGGNLVTRQAFLPFLHELVYHLADPAAYDLDLDPGWKVSFTLPVVPVGAEKGEGEDAAGDGKKADAKEQDKQSDTPTGTSPAATGGAAAAKLEVTGPDGRPRSAGMTVSGRDAVFTLEGDISSGPYRVTFPEEERSRFRRVLHEGSAELPFTVKRDPAESHLDPLTEEDERFLADFVTVARPRTLEELVGFLSGNQFGQELWKFLALGAFFFLLAEIALSRWIARSRRMGEEIEVDFTNRDAPGEGFRDQLARMGKG